MEFTVEVEQEDDGRWLAEVVEISGALKYGRSREDAVAQVEALVLRVIADRIEHGERLIEPISISFAAA